MEKGRSRPRGANKDVRTDSEQKSETGIQGVRLARYRKRQLKGADCRWGHGVRIQSEQEGPRDQGD